MSRGKIKNLSVSTSGSRPLPQRNSFYSFVSLLHLSVSTSGSRPLPRYVTEGESQPSIDFQYPQADRDPCHAPGSAPDQREENFQYPQADRDPCHNPARPPRHREHQATFSIHKRIETPATAFQILRVLNDRLFQYPQADRDPCHEQEELPARGWLDYLSVSTSGSRPLPRQRQMFCRAGQRLSVSTSGSRPLPRGEER